MQITNSAGRVVIFLVGILLFHGCAANRHDSGYERLLMYHGSPSQTVSFECGDGALEFRRFNNWGMEDTIVAVKIKNDRVVPVGGISLRSTRNEYERFDNMSVVEYRDKSFFRVELRNSGNTQANELRMYYIEAGRCSYHEVDIFRADSRLRESLPEGLCMWNDEVIEFRSDSIVSRFDIWKTTDPHSDPTGGRVEAVYDMIERSKNNFQLRPVEMKVMIYPADNL